MICRIAISFACVHFIFFFVFRKIVSILILIYTAPTYNIHESKVPYTCRLTFFYQETTSDERTFILPLHWLFNA